MLSRKSLAGVGWKLLIFSDHVSCRSCMTALTKSTIFSSSGEAVTGRSATTSVAPPPPLPTTSNRLTPVSQEPMRRTTTPPIPSGMPNPPPRPPLLPRASSMLSRLPAVQRISAPPEITIQQLSCRPPFGRVPEVSRKRAVERAATGFPAVSLDDHLRPIDAQHVARVQLTTPASGQRAGLNNERRMSLDAVPIGGVPDVTDVQVSRKEKIGPCCRKLLHGHRCAADEVVRSIPLWQIERMMSHD